MSNQRLRLSLIQANPVTGDVTHNTDMAIAALGTERDADLIVFSECFLTGYPVNDLVLRPGFLREVEEGLAHLREAVIAADGPAVLVGAPMAAASLPYNAAYLIEPSGEVRAVRKSELPNTDVFDERRTFAMANPSESAPLLFRGFRLGVQICEDMWHGPVSRALADECAEALIVINGSPYQRGKAAARAMNAQARVRATGLPLVYVNQVGGQDDLVFDGRSFTMNPDGGAMTGAAFRPDVMRVSLVRGDSGVHIESSEERAPSFAPAAGDGFPAEIAEDYAACVLGLRDYVEKTRSPRVFVGVSGGLDSALVLSMAVDALGPERVVGVMMPSEHTGPESLALADDLMSRLGVRRRVIPITGAYDALDAAVSPEAESLAAEMGVRASHEITRQNYQARARGVVLMGLSNALGGIVLSTGNKSEMAVGYSTLYGDMVGGFNPLKSVYKSDAFVMARWRNACAPAAEGLLGGAAPIPERIIDRPPTAELAPGQTDQDSLGAYEVLDAVLRAMIEGRMGPEAAARLIKREIGEERVAALCGGDTPLSYALKVARMLRAAQYKRVQAPPGVKLNETDFGLGWRYPVAGSYRL